MTTAGIARYNFRLTGKEIDSDAIGGVLQNWQAGSSEVIGRFGGLLALSFASTMDSFIVSIGAFEIMQSTMGATYVSNVLGSGFNWWPIAINDQSAGGVDSVIHFFAPCTSITGSGIIIKGEKLSSNAISSGVLVGLVSNETVHFTVYGFVTSSP